MSEEDERTRHGVPSEDSELTTVSRRRMLQLSALLGGAGGIGMTADTVTAASACGESGPDPGTVDAYWDVGGGETIVNGCNRAALRRQKLSHASTVRYLGSYQKGSGDGGEWTHFFSIAGHSEFFRGGYGTCDPEDDTDADFWEPGPGVRRHKVTLKNRQRPRDALRTINANDIAGNPAAENDEGELSGNKKAVASAALTTAIGYAAGSFAGAGASIALALLSKSESRFDETEPTFQYGWDYGSGYYKCGSHFIDSGVVGGEDPSVTMIDESWGEYPLFHSVKVDISIHSSRTKTNNNQPDRNITEGSIIESTDSEQIRVTKTSTNTREIGAYNSTSVSSRDDLPRQLAYRISEDEDVARFAQFPGRVQTTLISGRIVE